MISIAGIGLSGVDSMVLQDGTEAAAKGAKESEIKALRIIAKGYYSAIMASKDPESQADNASKYISKLSKEDKAVYDQWSKGAYPLN